MDTPGFFDLPVEIRRKIYSKLLVFPDAICFNAYRLRLTSSFLSRPNKSSLNLSPKVALLNKQAYHEATEILYGLNHFKIENVHLFALFLDQIGLLSAALIRHLDIAFPNFHNDGHHVGMSLQEDSDGVRALNLIHERCRHVRILEMSLFSSHFIETRFNDCDSPRAVDQVLRLVDARFRSLPSLQEVRVNLYEEPVNTDAREKMRLYGWTIMTTKQSSCENDQFWDDSGYDYGFEVYRSYRSEREEEDWWEDFDRRNNSD